jgi:hypothetical protein
MFGKKRLFTVIALVTILALLPTTALAGGFTLDGVTVTFPDSYASCSPSDDITFTGITGSGKTVEYWFFWYDAPNNIFVPVEHGYLSADALVPFPYSLTPFSSSTGTMTFGITVMAPGFNNFVKWSVTCETPPPPPPPPGGEGCTPGYWRNHFEDWPPTGYSPSADFDATFGVDYFNPNITLGQAVVLGGGGVNAVARHGTAGLLSAAHPDVDYPYTVAEVIAFVQAGDKSALEEANELGCSIP